jgi:hypothetical protein
LSGMRADKALDSATPAWGLDLLSGMHDTADVSANTGSRAAGSPVQHGNGAAV